MREGRGVDIIDKISMEKSQSFKGVNKMNANTKKALSDDGKPMNLLVIKQTIRSTFKTKEDRISARDELLARYPVEPKIKGLSDFIPDLVWEFEKHNYNSYHGTYSALTKFGTLSFESDDLIVISILNDTAMTSEFTEIKTVQEAKEVGNKRYKKAVEEYFNV